MTRLVDAWNNDDENLQFIAIKALMIMQNILLQKHGRNSKSKDHSEHLKKRLIWWEEGEFDKLMDEARSIQHRLKQNPTKTSNEDNITSQNDFPN